MARITFPRGGGSRWGQTPIISFSVPFVPSVVSFFTTEGTEGTELKASNFDPP